jgi:hypothetical protein
MLASNVHPKIASERLGHSRVGITLDLYSHVVKGCSHVVEGLQENAVALVDDAMAKALQKRAAEQGSSRVAKEGWRPPSPLAISKPWATWRSGYATVCKTVYTGSIPVVASNKINSLEGDGPKPDFHVSDSSGK